MFVTMVEMQEPTEFLQPKRERESMGSPQSGGMAAGIPPGPGQGLHTPASTRPPLPALVISPSQAATPGTSTSLPEIGPSGSLSAGPRPIMSVPPPPPGVSLSMVMTGTPVAGGEQPLKRKRGRPRKYAALESSPGVPGAPYPALSGSVAGSSSPYTPSEKRGRGRPPGSGKKQQLAALGVVLAGTGQGFTPHILTVNTGEDVSTKIMQFAQHGPRAMCVLSANGAISNVTLRQQSSSGGTVTYEGRYEILSLSGSYLPTDLGGGNRQRTGGLSVSLAGSDGRVIGGGVAGMLTAASPIQVVVGSFLSDAFRTQPKAESPLGSTPGGTSGAGTASGSAPGAQRPPAPRSEPKGSSAPGPQQVTASPSSTSQVSAIRPHNLSMMGSYQMSSWPAPPPLGEGRRTDINISLPGG